MASKVQRLILLGSLGVGYYIYRNALREVIYQNQNTFLNTPLLDQLRETNYTVVGQNRVLIGNPINKTYESSRERIVIIGGGLAGLGTAYYLSKLKKYDVIVVEHNDAFSQTTRLNDAGVFSPSSCYPVTDYTFMLDGLKSLYNKNTAVNMGPKVVMERYFSIWLSNYMINLGRNAHAEGCKKLAYLANLGTEEISTLNTEMEFNEICNMTAKGTIHLYSTAKSLEADQYKVDALKAAGVNVRQMDRDQINIMEPGIKASLDSFEGGYLGAMDTNANVEKFGEKLAQIAEINGTTLITGAEFHRFLFHKEANKVVGVITSQGIVLCDKVVVASGFKSKDIMHKLGVRLPMLGLQQYSIIANWPKDKQPLTHNITDDLSKAFVSPMKKKLLVTGCQDLGYDAEWVRDERVQFLINSTKSKVGEIDMEAFDVWSSKKGLSADDVPVIGSVPKYDNVYVNAGHGNKGLTLTLGSGKVMSEIIDQRVKKDVESDYSLDRFYLV